jgi:type IV pilus assembly protein PilA
VTCNYAAAVKSPILQRFGFVLILAGLGTPGCHKSEAPPASAPAATAAQPAEPPPLQLAVVKPAERSRHFTAVTRQLELGGTVYGYVDIDGDAGKLARSAGALVQELARAQPQLAGLAKQDFAALFTVAGFNDVKAIGVSSVPDGTGFFRNRFFLYTPEGRHGLLKGLGGPPAPFTHLKLAPADADVYSETELDVPAVYDAVRDLVGRIGGEQAQTGMQDGLKRAGESAAISVLNVINGMKGRASFVLRFDAEKTMRLPGPAGVTLPAFSWMLCVDGVAQAIEPALARSPVFARLPETALALYALRVPVPLECMKPVIGIEGGRLYIASTAEFLTTCRTQPAGLGELPALRASLAQLGETGNGLSYVSPRFFSRLRDLEKLNAGAKPDVQRVLHLITRQLAVPDRPIVAVRQNLPEGILVRAYQNRSVKNELALAAVYNPVTVGVMAAMAIPAFQKVRLASQQKAVLNNLRQLAAAADQHYLENGVDEATYDDLVGPDHYIKALHVVAGEDYRTLRFKQGQPLRIRLPDGRVVEYNP